MFSRIFNFRSAGLVKNLAFGTAALTIYNLYLNNEQSSQCCGILGVLSKSQNVANNYLVNGFEILRDRGYDSAGVASFDEQTNFVISKSVNDAAQKVDSIDKITQDIQKSHNQAFTAIGHTRWATCGSKTIQNCHPHQDYKDRVAIIHNGLIQNTNELAAVIKKKNIPLRSQTDSELIAQCIGIQLDMKKSFYDACFEVVKLLQGTWGLIVIDKQNPKQMIVSSHGSPVHIANDENSIYVSSDERVFSKYTQNYFTEMSKEIMLLDIESIETSFYKRKDKIVPIPSTIQNKPREPYNSFFEQEIDEQHDGIKAALGNGSRLLVEQETCKLGGLELFKDQILGIKNIVLVATGSSYFAAQYASKYFKILKCFNTVQVFEAAEFTEYDIPSKQGGAILISSSGETDTVKKALGLAKHAGIFTIGVVNRVASTIANQTHCGVYINSGKEFLCPATKSFTNQNVVLLLIAIWVSKLRNPADSFPKRAQLVQELSKLPDMFNETLKYVENQCFKVAETLAETKDLMVLAKGISEPISKEGALKLKQVAYLHAEAFSSGEMKHGPIALIDSTFDNKSKVLLIILDNEDYMDMTLALSEVKARQAYTIVITDCKQKLEHSCKEKIDQYIEILKIGELTTMLSIIVFQKIANYICVQKKINPDAPRGVKFSVVTR